MFNFLKKLSKKESGKLEDCLAQNGMEFSSHEEAEKFLFDLRDKDLEAIEKLNQSFPELNLDRKAKSLERLEKFYWKAYADNTIKLDIPKERMEELITQYMRQVFVSNDMAEWQAIENSFAEGRYYLGLMLGYGADTSENYAERLHKEDNVNRTALFDYFMHYVPEERESEVL